MSTYYNIYTEANINGKWICIDGMVPKLEYDYEKHERNENKIEYKLEYTYWNGSRSYFGDTYDRLRDWGKRTSFSDLSKELQDEWKGAIEIEADGGYVDKPIVVDYSRIESSVDFKKFDYHRVVRKDQIFRYESGEDEDIWIEEIDMGNLSEEQKKEFQYYEWDDPMGANAHLKVIKERAFNEICRFESINSIWNSDGNIKYRLVIITS